MYVVSFQPTLCGQFETHEADVSMGGCELYMFSKPSPSSFLQKWYPYCFHIDRLVDVMQHADNIHELSEGSICTGCSLCVLPLMQLDRA